MKKLWQKQPKLMAILLVLTLMTGLFASTALVLALGIQTTAWVLFSLILGTPVLGFGSALLAGLLGSIIASGTRNPVFEDSEDVSYHPTTGLEMNGGVDIAGNTIGSD